MKEPLPLRPSITVLERLESHHIRGLTREHSKIIASRIRFGNLSKAGEQLGYSPSQMRRRWDQLKELILIPLGLPPHDDMLAGIWIAFHQEDCTFDALQLLKTDVRYSSE